MAAAEWGKGLLGRLDGRGHSALFKAGEQRGRAAQGALPRGVWRLEGAEFGGGWTRVHVWPMLFPVHLEQSQHCESASLSTEGKG